MGLKKKGKERKGRWKVSIKEEEGAAAAAAAAAAAERKKNAATAPI